MVAGDDVAAWLASDEWSANTRCSARASVRAFFAWVRSTGRRRDDPTAALLAIAPTPGRPRPCPESALLVAVRRAGDRERLMLALGACAGLRRAEIAQCRGDALERDLDGWSLRVVGKGGRVRRVPLSDDLAEQVQARGTGWTFQGQMRAGRAIHGDRSAGHLSAGRVGELVSELLPDGWTTHTLRHRFASAAYRADRDIRAVQELLGHVSVATTQVYTAVPDDAKRRAALAAGIAA
ncbi:tyrosine-type recombinase/integrase [Tsukamurella pulmonis]|uniref:tyrosine-type recombinase/integrase n=1 Tax=Tsukamurella pulmonis TaxID=47312 RepID=UPI000E08D4D5|nr:integrase [Tsukamurella pulmonis]